MESRWRTSPWLRSCTSAHATGESASRSPSDNPPTSGYPKSKTAPARSRFDPSADASRLRLAEALEVSAHRIEEDENHREDQVDEQRDRRVHEGDRDGHRGDHGTDREPDAHFEIGRASCRERV